jgi:hypothetical protein
MMMENEFDGKKHMNWIRLVECPVCGQKRCVKNGRRIYCFRYSDTFFEDKNGFITGSGHKKIIAEKSPQKSLNFNDDLPYHHH